MANKTNILPEDVLTGLSGCISVFVQEPKFSSQAKEKLSGADEKKAIYEALVRELKKFRNSLSEQERKAINQKIVNNAKVRQAADIAKATKRKSLVNKSPANLPSKLKECRNVGDELSELYICEGDSAAGTLTAARNADYVAVMPIRGKILNVMKMDLGDKKQLERFNQNAEINDIIRALGAGVGQHFDPDKARYGKVVFACDGDVDGMAINTLLTGVFYKLFRPMIEEGRVYQCVTPFYEMKYRKNGKEVVEYAVNESDRMRIEAKLKKAGVKYNLGRAKGLGEISAQDFHDFVLDPRNRKLIRITLEDAEACDKMIKLAIGYESSADDRKEWMLNHTSVIDELGLYQ